MKSFKIVSALILFGVLLQFIVPEHLFARSRVQQFLFSNLVEWSDLIVVVQPTKMVSEPANQTWNKPAGGWVRLQVLEVWKGSLKKKSFTMGWGYYSHAGYGQPIYGTAKHLMFLKRGARNVLYGTVEEWSYWPLQQIRFPGLEEKREAIVYQSPVNNFIFPVPGQYMLRDTATKQMHEGERMYQKAILLNEFRIYVEGVLETLRMKKRPAH